MIVHFRRRGESICILDLSFFFFSALSAPLRETVFCPLSLRQ
jgi:hypothetical protein